VTSSPFDSPDRDSLRRLPVDELLRILTRTERLLGKDSRTARAIRRELERRDRDAPADGEESQVPPC
jgi:hypothetical protein